MENCGTQVMFESLLRREQSQQIAITAKAYVLVVVYR